MRPSKKRPGASKRAGRAPGVGGAALGHVVAMGVLFAVVQFGLFFQLQLRLTAAYPSFLTVTLAWLIGSVAGLWLGRRGQSTLGFKIWLAASLVSYYLVMVLLRVFPYTIALLPVLGLLIVICGIQAGQFFAANRSLLESSASLFFWENNGFVLGWIVGYAGYVAFGNAFHWEAPALAGLAAYALRTPIADEALTA